MGESNTPMVRITAIDDYHPDMWSNRFVGQAFPLVKIHEQMIPKQYEMDVSELKREGRVTFDRMYVPVYCAEIDPPAAPVERDPRR